ncbi:T9SS type A sorting domain-containing protein, partial [Agriterribacter sp.]|uniref:T9SS type A sorting domain-containing protein n=1 Tax=Agriterribacter sp. TaxID=2821509 RepID=UPI002C292AAD
VVVTNSEATRLTLSSETIEISSVLPLTWLYFTASNCSDNMCLQWQTQNEQHTSHFEIERSVDGQNFMQLSRVTSQNKPGTHIYNTTDDSPAYGTNYYRIKQVDFDGRYSYSDIVSVKVMNTGKWTISPNPANDFIVLSGTDKAERVILYSISGQMLRQWQHVTANQQLYISDLQKGMYIIKVLHRNGEAVHKIIRQ